MGVGWVGFFSLRACRQGSGPHLPTWAEAGQFLVSPESQPIFLNLQTSTVWFPSVPLPSGEGSYLS